MCFDFMGLEFVVDIDNGPTLNHYNKLYRSTHLLKINIFTISLLFFLEAEGNSLRVGDNLRFGWIRISQILIGSAA